MILAVILFNQSCFTLWVRMSLESVKCVKFVGVDLCRHGTKHLCFTFCCICQHKTTTQEPEVLTIKFIDKECPRMWPHIYISRRMSQSDLFTNVILQFLHLSTSSCHDHVIISLLILLPWSFLFFCLPSYHQHPHSLLYMLLQSYSCCIEMWSLMSAYKWSSRINSRPKMHRSVHQHTVPLI